MELKDWYWWLFALAWACVFFYGLGKPVIDSAVLGVSVAFIVMFLVSLAKV